MGERIFEYLRSVEGRLRDCQRRAVEKFAEFCDLPEESNRAFLVNLPTGAGKTGVISLLAHLSDEAKVLIICHRKAVKDQLYREVARKFFRTTLGDAEVVLKKTFRDDSFDKGDGIYISSFQKLSMLDDDELSRVQDGFDLIIVDEGHSEPSPVWREIIRQSDARKVVVTATPYRNDLFELNVSTEKFYVFTFHNAVESEVILAPIFSQVRSDEHLVEVVSGFLSENEGLKCIIKCRGLEEIEKYHDLFSPLFTTVSVHDRIARSDADFKFKSISKALKVPGLRIVIHQHKLDEGVDIPEAKLLVLTYPLGSGRELVQAVGRVVRVYGDIDPSVLDMADGSNQGMWEGYIRFDNYISSENGAGAFVKSLSTTYLIESFLDGFPEYSYFGSRFRERVDLNKIDPGVDITVPLASVCFIQKLPAFSLPLLMDRIYWELHGSGALVKEYQEVFGMSVIIYVSFSSSRFFSDKLFFEPKLDLIIVKESDESVAVFDSGGGRYYNQEKYGLGNSIHINKLTALAATTQKRQIKETHARAIGQALRRPEAIAVKGANLDNSQSEQRNAMYALTMVKVDNIGLDGKKDSSYYIGARSGRIADQKERNFSLQDVSEWIDKINNLIATGGNAGRLIRSYAQPVLDVPQSAILSVILDFSALPGACAVRAGTIYPDFYYVPYDDGICLSIEGEDVELSLEYKGGSSEYKVRLKDEFQNVPEFKVLEEYINSSPILKVLFEDGVTHFDSSFYRLALPFEQGIRASESWASNAIYDIDVLLSPRLKEKGDYIKGRGYCKTTESEFDPDSIFYMLDQLKRYGDRNSAVGDLGPFADYIPGCDLVICCDMGTEPGDFIISSPGKLCFVHVKCGAAADNPQSSAGALAEVGGQAIKNIHLLVSNADDIKPGNFKSWNGRWPSNEAEFSLSTRYRLFDGKINHPVLADGSLSQRVWELICERRRSLRVKKEIWIVSGNSFSKSHFIRNIESAAQSLPETIQAYQLIENWLGTANDLDVDMKIFTSQ